MNIYVERHFYTNIISSILLLITILYCILLGIKMRNFSNVEKKADEFADDNIVL